MCEVAEKMRKNDDAGKTWLEVMEEVAENSENDEAGRKF